MKQKKYYHYCVELLKPSGELWFLATFENKMKARLWLSGFRHGVIPMQHIDYSPKVGRQYVRYFNFRPSNGHSGAYLRPPPNLIY